MARNTLNLLSRGIKKKGKPVGDLKVVACGDQWLESDQKQTVNYFRIEGTRLIKTEKPNFTSLESFDSLTQQYDVDKEYIDVLQQDLNFKQPTRVQSEVIPIGINGGSFLASAPTGSGKTMAFLIPLLYFLIQRRNRQKPRKKCSGLILSPTRELAEQTLRQMLLLMSSKKEFSAGSIAYMQKGAYPDVLICTPGLINCLVEDEKILKHTRIIIFDEVDLLLDTSFVERSDQILARCTSKKKQVMMFSATLPPKVLELASSLIFNALVIKTGSNTPPSEIEQRLIPAAHEIGKYAVLKQLIEDKELIPPCLIFVQEKERAIELHIRLRSRFGNKVDVLHSGQSQNDRQKSLCGFRTGEIWILICSDVLARGVDCYGVQLVINYDFPTSRESYIHRIGRTGRAGVPGKAITLYTTMDEPNLRIVTDVMKRSGADIPKEARRLWRKRSAGSAADAPPTLRVRPPKRRPIVYMDRKVKKSDNDKNDKSIFA